MLKDKIIDIPKFVCERGFYRYKMVKGVELSVLKAEIDKGKVFAEECYDKSPDKLRQAIYDLVSRANRPSKEGGYSAEIITQWVLDDIYCMFSQVKKDIDEYKKSLGGRE